MNNNNSKKNSSSFTPHQHGVKGVYYGGDWLDLEDCHEIYTNLKSDCASCPAPCPRSQSRNVPKDDDAADSTTTTTTTTYDICLIGAGCIGASIARELSKYSNKILWLEAADDVSQGATKGNSGIVHAGYDDKPNTNRSKYCWKGNQMFEQLDRELKFGYQKNGSLVLAFSQDDVKHLEELKKRGETNGVQRLQIVTNQEELRKMEPNVHPDAIAALYSPDAGNVIPYEFTIALAENAVDNGVELKIRRQVTAIEHHDDGIFAVTARYWEPKAYLQQTQGGKSPTQLVVMGVVLLSTLISAGMGMMLLLDKNVASEDQMYAAMATYAVLVCSALFLWNQLVRPRATTGRLSRRRSMEKLVAKAGTPHGGTKGVGTKVRVQDMLVGGSGSAEIMEGETVRMETIRAKYVVNCAGGASDQIASMIGDKNLFQIKPRLGDYLLLNRNQGSLARHTIFPCPDPVLGKGVLVQTTLWGNLILGPTARDVSKPQARDMTIEQVQEYILSKCKRLVPSFDPKETFHAFCGARAKSTRGDWIIEPSKTYSSFIHVAGIDSPGLAGSPAIALDVVKLLRGAGLDMIPNPTFQPNRDPIITPKAGLRGLKMGPPGKNDSTGGGGGANENYDEEEDEVQRKKMASNVICKCEKVTEMEVVRAMRRSLPIDSSQGIRKRTRAGMGHCQGDPDNYSCEARVRAIIARENGVPISHVGARPWPATSTLTQRWIDEEEKKTLEKRSMEG